MSSFFAHKKLKKPPSKVAQKNSNPLFSPYCLELPKRPKRKNSCSKMWLIDQLYIELGFVPYEPGYALNDLLVSCHFPNKMKSSTQRNPTFFLLKVKEFEILHCIQPSVIRTADHEWVLQEAKVMKHRTKKYTRYSFRKEFTTVLEKSPETTSNALLGTQWGQQ